MNTDNRRIVISALILLGIGCICCCIVAVGAWATWAIFPEFSAQPSGVQGAPTAQTPTTKPTATRQANAPVTPSDGIPPYVVAQMDIIQDEVIALRGLSSSQPVTRALLSPEQLQQRVIEDFLADYSAEEAQQDTVILAALGLLEPGFDLLKLYEELLTEQVAGFYDNETKEMYVVQAQAFEGLERMVYAHEYTHVLQDQVYDFENGLGYNDDACDADSERCFAIQALIEGDATLAELNWFQQYSTEEDKQQVMDFYETYTSPVLDSAPEFLKQDFLFPYNNGLAFVQSLYDQGGWEAVDNAYRTLPTSTEQILHPEKYPSEQPIVVDLPDFGPTLGDGWVELERGVMGEWYTNLILGYGSKPDWRLEESVAQEAADGWGGDSYTIYQHAENQQIAMLLHFIWDTPEDASEFVQAFRTYATARFGEPSASESDRIIWQDSHGVHELRIQDQETSWISAPQADISEAIWEALQP